MASVSPPLIPRYRLAATIPYDIPNGRRLPPPVLSTAQKVYSFASTHWSSILYAATTIFILRSEGLKQPFKCLFFIGAGMALGKIMHSMARTQARATIAENSTKLAYIRELLAAAGEVIPPEELPKRLEALNAQKTALEAPGNEAAPNRTEELQKVNHLIQIMELKDPARAQNLQATIEQLRGNITQLEEETAEAQRLVNNVPDECSNSDHVKNIVYCIGMLVLHYRGCILSPTGFLDRWVFSSIFGVTPISLGMIGMSTLYVLYNDARKRRLI